MTPWALRLGRDVSVAFWALTLTALVLVLFLDGVEAASSGLGIASALTGAPSKLLFAAPVIGGLACGGVLLRWQRSGRVQLLQAAGVSPRLPVGVAAVTVGLCLVLGVGAREAWVPWSSERALPASAWLSVGHTTDDLEVLVRADRVVGPTLSGVQVAWLDAGVLVARGELEQARWHEGWSPAAATGRWVDGRSVVLDLPSWSAWTRAVPLGTHDGLFELAASSHPAAWVWLLERLLMPLCGGALALVTAAAGCKGRAAHVGVAVAGVLLWRLFEGGAVAAAAQGIWPAERALGLSAGIALTLGILAWWMAEREPRR